MTGYSHWCPCYISDIGSVAKLQLFVIILLFLLLSVHLGICLINLVFHTHHNFSIILFLPEDTDVISLSKSSSFILLQMCCSLSYEMVAAIS